MKKVYTAGLYRNYKNEVILFYEAACTAVEWGDVCTRWISLSCREYKQHKWNALKENSVCIKWILVKKKIYTTGLAYCILQGKEVINL